MIGAALLLMLSTVPEQSETSDCDDPPTQLAMNLCSQRDYESADAALNAEWAATSAQMKARDEERPDDGLPGHFETLLAAQRAWLAYRDAHCLGERFMARGGSMAPMLQSQCLTYLTQLRTEQLRNLAVGLEG